MRLLVALSILAVAAAADPSESIAELCRVFQSIEGKTLSEAKFDEFRSRLSGLFAPLVSCKQVSSSEEWGFDLVDVPVSECMEQAIKRYSGMHPIRFACDDTFVDSSGKNAVIHQPVTVKTPSQRTVKLDVFRMLEFNDAGQIVKVNTQFDTSALQAERVGSQNSAAVKKLCDIAATEMKESTIGWSMVKKLVPQMEDLFAEKVDCVVDASSKNFGYVRRGVPIWECAVVEEELYRGLQVLDVSCEDIFADEDGQSLVIDMPMTLKLSTGKRAYLRTYFKLSFDGEGKIKSYRAEFDSSVLQDETPAARNVATITELYRLAKEVEGRIYDRTMVADLLPKMEAFFAPRIDCNVDASSKDFGYARTGVPLSECAAAEEEKYRGMEVAQFSMDDIFADEGGRSLMVDTLMRLRLTSGRTVELRAYCKFNFNHEGKIMSYSAQFDTSPLQEGGEVELIARPASQGYFWASSFAVGALLASAAILIAMKRRPVPSLLEGYREGLC
mmetsp:Transcript_55887/g.120905  ORF Transcript_55887/g.120905 Transcript_55887/m.120905 type:complete len:501 (-) Transcript_55887:419-1921(-)